MCCDGCRCAYSDLILALRRLRSVSGGAIQKCMIIDLDVHQASYPSWSFPKQPIRSAPAVCALPLHSRAALPAQMLQTLLLGGSDANGTETQGCGRSLLQGNGHERDKLHLKDADLFVVDIYGKVPALGLLAQKSVKYCRAGELHARPTAGARKKLIIQ